MELKNTRIIHVTPHMGGGVGRVLMNLCEDFGNLIDTPPEIVCLDYLNESAVEWARARGIAVLADARHCLDKAFSLLERADIVHLHWWNHPLAYDFLRRMGNVPCRLVIWAHVNGYNPPNIFREHVCRYPDKFVLGTGYSLEQPLIKNMDRAWRDTNLRVVFASPGYRHCAGIEPKIHEKFNVTYIGTVDYSKMHPNFVELCSSIAVPNVQFIVCGGPAEQLLREEVQRRKLQERFDIRGSVKDVPDVLSQSDVFGYPLISGHYGASEVVLIEAQAAGIPPVVLDNGVERFIVEDKVTGFIVSSPEEYKAAVEYLYSNKEKRRSMGAAGRRRAAEKFHIGVTSSAWLNIYREALAGKKRLHDWTCRASFEEGEGKATELFFSALGESDVGKTLRALLQSRSHDKDLRSKIQSLPPVFFGNSNGSAKQYAHFFPEDPDLAYLVRALEQIGT